MKLFLRWSLSFGFFTPALSGATPDVTKTFADGDRDSMGLVHDQDIAMTVSVVKPGHQADGSGIKVGWRLVEINGKPAAALSNYAMVSALSVRPLALKYRIPNQPDQPCNDDVLQQLYKAVSKDGKVADVYQLLEDYKCPLNAKIEGTEMPLMHLAAEVGKIGTVRALSSYGGKVDLPFNGKRPLHIAIENQRTYASHWLVTLGADTTARDADGFPMPHFAAKHCATEVLKVFKMKDLAIFEEVNGKRPGDIARENCEAKFADQMARWLSEHEEEKHKDFTKKLKMGEL